MGIKIDNICSFKIKAVAWHKVRGLGKTIEIEPDKAGEVEGPFSGELGRCLPLSRHPIKCQESGDCDEIIFYQVLPGVPAMFTDGDIFIYIMHHADKFKSRKCG